MAPQLTEPTSQPDQGDERLAKILTLCKQMTAERHLQPLLHLIAQEGAQLMQADRATSWTERKMSSGPR